jgi:hypothetical protein
MAFKDVVYTNGDYRIYVGKQEGTDHLVYKVQNAKTGVVEGEEFMLPRAMLLCADLAEFNLEIARAEAGKGKLQLAK